jgi:hypothetical protein
VGALSWSNGTPKGDPFSLVPSKRLIVVPIVGTGLCSDIPTACLYAPWVRSRQEQLEADLTRAWGLDPVIAAQTSQARGTRRVHEKKQRSNSHILKRENWRRGWDSNPRMEVLQTSPLGHLGTAPLPRIQWLTATTVSPTSDVLPNLLPLGSPDLPEDCQRLCSTWEEYSHPANPRVTRSQNGSCGRA